MNIMKLFLSIPFALIAHTLFAQPAIEVELLSRYDRHAKYTSRYFDRSYTNDITLSGISSGFNVKYVTPILKNLSANFGIGYYRLGVNNVSFTTRFGRPNSRTIAYRHPQGIQPGFSSDKYFYNNLALTLGTSFNMQSKKISYLAGADVQLHYSISQQYHIDWGDGLKYKTSHGRPLGFGVNTYVAIVKPVNKNKYYISPKIIIPLFQRIKGDRVFGEDESLKIDKWFSGYGFSISIGKYL